MGFASAGEESGNGRSWGEWKLNAGSHTGTLRCRTPLSPAASGEERVSAAGGSRDALWSRSEATASRGRGAERVRHASLLVPNALARVRRLTLPSPLVGEGLGERGRTLATRLAPSPFAEAEQRACRLSPAADTFQSPSEAKAGRGRGGQHWRHAFPPSPQPLSLQGRGAQSRYWLRLGSGEHRRPTKADARFPALPTRGEGLEARLGLRWS
jgi:hypothetical protein